MPVLLLHTGVDPEGCHAFKDRPLALVTRLMVVAWGLWHHSRRQSHATASEVQMLFVLTLLVISINDFWGSH